jgi:head-tail adaptor
MISPAELAAMQATASSALDQTITVKRATLTSDGAGGSSESFATVHTVSGNLAQPSAGMLQNYDYLVGSVSSWLLRVAVGTDIRINDRLTVGSLTVRVQVLLQPQSYQTSMRFLCAEVQ